MTRHGAWSILLMAVLCGGTAWFVTIGKPVAEFDGGFWRNLIIFGSAFGSGMVQLDVVITADARKERREARENLS